MTKHFLRLYLLVLVPLLALILSSPLQPLIDRWVSALAEEQYRGTSYLLQQELKTLPQSEWPTRVEALARHFGRKLELARIDSPQISEEERRALYERGHTYIRSDALHAHAWWRIGDSDYAIYTGFGESPEVQADRDASGTAYLIKRYLDGYDDLQQGVRELAPHFGFPLALQHEAELNFDDAQKALLDQGMIIGGGEGARSEIYYGRAGHGDWILVAGPLDDHNINERVMLAFSLIPTVLIAMALLFWLRPLWRDLKRLKTDATHLGEGDLAVRTEVPKSSALHLLATTFNRMADSIQQLVEGQKELTHAVSHEFKTPVARLRFALEMLRDHPVAADRERYLGGMESDLDELEGLIGELLTHARYDRPDLAIHPEPVDLLKWLELRMADHRRGNDRIAIALQDDGVTGPAMFDPIAMEKLINNLLANALRHARSLVQVSAKCSGTENELCVEDDGPGVPEEECEAIFNPFYRLDESRERGTGGTGLGLAIVRRVIERHGGTVSCEKSNLGGARFCVRWPVALKQEARKA